MNISYIWVSLNTMVFFRFFERTPASLPFFPAEQAGEVVIHARKVWSTTARA